MSHDRLAIHALRFLGATFLVISALCLVDPRVLLSGMEISLETPSALAEARAGYCGAFAGLALVFLRGASDDAVRSLALGVATVVLGLFTAARVLGLAIDGTPNDLAMVNHALEGVGFLLAGWLWRTQASDTATS